MKKLVALCAFVALLCIPVSAQETRDPNTAVDVTPFVLGEEAAALLLYSDGAKEVRLADGELVATITAAGNKQVLRTKWKDKDGVQHEVETEYTGKTEGSRSAAAERHKSAVLLQQALFPPA